MIDEEPHTSIDFLGYFRLGDLVSSLMLSVSVKHNVIFMWLTNSYRAAFFFFFSFSSYSQIQTWCLGKKRECSMNKY